MNKITIIKDVLKSLCANQYSLEDIRVFVNYLSDECIDYLKKSGEIKYILYHEKGNLEQKLEDYAIDLIGPLFARDERGAFFILKNQLLDYLEDSDEKLTNRIHQILKISVKQGMIQFYGETDPIGKIFYRSLRYLLEKNREWVKTEIKVYGLSICRAGIHNMVASNNDVIQAFHQFQNNKPTTVLSKILTDLIDQKNMVVPISTLLTNFRDHINSFHDLTVENYVNDDFDDSFAGVIEDMANKVDRSMLSKYESTGKINEDERIGFKKAVITLLTKEVTHGTGQ